MKKIALITGASGLVGNELLKLLLENPEYGKVRVIVRRSLENNHPKLDEHIVDFDHPDSFHDLIKADHIFCCLGTTMKKAGTKENFYKVDFTYAYEIARMGLENKCQQFNLISSVGAHPKSFFYYLHVKGMAEREISNLGYPQLNIFRPGFLLGERKEKRPLEDLTKKISKIIKPLLILGLKKHQPVQAQAVARAMMKVANKEKNGLKIYNSNHIDKIGRE